MYGVAYALASFAYSPFETRWNPTSRILYILTIGLDCSRRYNSRDTNLATRYALEIGAERPLRPAMERFKSARPPGEIAEHHCTGLTLPYNMRPGISERGTCGAYHNRDFHLGKGCPLGRHPPSSK